MSYNLFLDDERYPPNDKKLYIIVRSYKEFCEKINDLRLPNFISFDHDLDIKQTGLDCAKFLIEYCLNNKLKPNFKFYVHSQNPIGKENIEKLLNGFIEFSKHQGEKP